MEEVLLVGGGLVLFDGHGVGLGPRDHVL